MREILIILLLICIQGTKLPKFEDYPVNEIFKGKPTKPILKKNSQEWHFKTNINNGASQGVNFAGHFTIVEWGCGTICQEYAIVDLQNGKVYMPQGKTGRTSYGLIYKTNSNLLITDPIDSATAKGYELKIPAWLTSYYYVWDGSKMNLIDSTKTIYKN